MHTMTGTPVQCTAINSRVYPPGASGQALVLKQCDYTATAGHRFKFISYYDSASLRYFWQIR